MDITIRRGDTEVLEVTVLDDDDAPVPIAAATFAFTVKRSRKDPDDRAVITLTTGTGIVATDAPAGKLEVTISAAQSGALTPGRYDYDLQMTDSGIVTTIVDGTMLVEGDVTRGP